MVLHHRRKAVARGWREFTRLAPLGAARRGWQRLASVATRARKRTMKAGRQARSRVAVLSGERPNTDSRR
jgi:hypothetical protein